MKKISIILAFLFLGAAIKGHGQDIPAVKKLPPPEACKACHERQYKEWKKSYHARAVSLPTFRAMFSIHNLEEPERPETCLNCHAPEIKILNNTGELKANILEGKIREDEHGITCAVCHFMSDAPETSNNSVPIKLDMASVPPYHKVRSDKLTTSEKLCSGCHNYNAGLNGDVPCCTVNREWRKTKFAKEGKNCQSCHMRAEMGAMVVSPWERFKATLFTLTNLQRYRDDRNRVDHRFLGPRDPDFLKKGVEMALKVERKGESGTARVEILNKTGHTFPNGCPPRTRVVLKVWAQNEDGIRFFTGTREYGFDFINANGFVPGTPWGAVDRVNENFLEPEKTKEEVFEFDLPGGSGVVDVKATLTYVYIQSPPPEAKLKMQQMMGRRVMQAPPEERERVSEEVQEEVAVRMKGMRILTSYFPDLKMAEAEAELSLK